MATGATGTPSGTAAPKAAGERYPVDPPISAHADGVTETWDTGGSTGATGATGAAATATIVAAQVTR